MPEWYNVRIGRVGGPVFSCAQCLDLGKVVLVEVVGHVEVGKETVREVVQPSVNRDVTAGLPSLLDGLCGVNCAPSSLAGTHVRVGKVVNAALDVGDDEVVNRGVEANLLLEVDEGAEERVKRRGGLGVVVAVLVAVAMLVVVDLVVTVVTTVLVVVVVLIVVRLGRVGGREGSVVGGSAASAVGVPDNDD